jgi:hypothetical protein
MQAMLPEAVPLTAPMRVGLEKLPVAFDSSAVKVFPALNTPLTEKEMVTGLPAQKLF